MQTRLAKPGESKILSELAYESEAYWGYDQFFMDAFRAKYGVSEEQIQSGLVWVLENGDLTVGFFYIEVAGSLGDLEFFYIDPQFSQVKRHESLSHQTFVPLLHWVIKTIQVAASIGHTVKRPNVRP